MEYWSIRVKELKMELRKKWMVKLGVEWKQSAVRGCTSLLRLGSAALLLIMWSCFLALTSLTGLVYVIIAMGCGFGGVMYLGLSPGVLIGGGVFGIVLLWMLGNMWITATLLLLAAYLLSLNRHARLLILVAALYALYSVQTRLGWPGVFLSLNLAFFSNDALAWWDTMDTITTTTPTTTTSHIHANSSTILQDHFSPQSQSHFSSTAANTPAPTPSPSPSPTPCSEKTPEPQAVPPPPPPPKQFPSSSTVEMKRILNSLDHYDALGLPRHINNIDLLLLKKEYHKKAMLVHPDKNMGCPLASQSFQKLHSAYEVLSDFTKKRDYDEQLRKEESNTRTVCQRSHSTSNQSQDNPGYRSEESRRIQCTKCGNSHIWVCTNRSKVKARWCQDCCQYHQAKDGDGWVEYKGSLVFDRPHKVEIPRAFVCAESKIFDVSEWAICQGMACRPNTHRPSFHVNMVGLEKSQRSNSSRFPWDLDAEMNLMDDDEQEFELWLQQALDSGLFCETSKRRKSWTPFKLKTKKQWRRTSC